MREYKCIESNRILSITFLTKENTCKTKIWKGDMMKIIIGFFLLAVVFIVGCSHAADQGISSKVPTQGSEDVEEAIVADSGDVENENRRVETKGNVVEITSSGFSPRSLTMSQGVAVTFINRGSALSWPASAVHPTHKIYPGSDINKCATLEEKNIFDACKGLKQGESYSFTFNEKGSWRYHDHLNPSSTGVIIVE